MDWGSEESGLSGTFISKGSKTGEPLAFLGASLLTSMLSAVQKLLPLGFSRGVGTVENTLACGGMLTAFMGLTLRFFG